MKFQDLTGQKFNKLLVVSFCETRKTKPIWNCLCDCGSTKQIRSSDLKSGRQVSCGCHKSAVTSKRNAANKTHGLSYSRTYTSWMNMRRRCEYEGDKCWKYYGGLGVSVCERWKYFKNFVEDMGLRPEGKTIDRIDPFGKYTPENCRWATPKEQALNKRKKAAS